MPTCENGVTGTRTKSATSEVQPSQVAGKHEIKIVKPTAIGRVLGYLRNVP